jgi:hypothetical protein
VRFAVPTSSSETDVTESRNSLETDQRRLRRAGAVLADSDQNIAPRRAATNTDPDIATRHALGGQVESRRRQP